MSWRQKGKRPNYRRWRAVRLKALDRDGWGCVKCGHKGRLQVDHRIALEDGGAVYDTKATCKRFVFDCHFLKSQEERKGKPTPPEVLEWRKYLTTTTI